MYTVHLCTSMYTRNGVAYHPHVACQPATANTLPPSHARTSLLMHPQKRCLRGQKVGAGGGNGCARGWGSMRLQLCSCDIATTRNSSVCACPCWAKQTHSCLLVCLQQHKLTYTVQLDTGDDKPDGQARA
eukprot:355508-Chlamydomonas_euryale.AAC.7